MKILFFYLKAFSFTGGIEKFNRSFLKALHELSVDGFFDADAISVHDNAPDEKYFPRLRFRGYKGAKVLFLFRAIVQSFRYDILIIAHINLAIVGYLIKWIKPSIKLVIIAHGIEVWERHKGVKLGLLEKADMILSVSNFTKWKITELNPTIRPSKIFIFPNAIDPYFSLPVSFAKPKYLLERYGLDEETSVLLTVTRLHSSEKYKGYDRLIESMPTLASHHRLKYLLCGKSDSKEESRIMSLMKESHAEDLVKLPGFIDEKELTDHYLLADVFIMLSKKEGFGIVFIEALACGRKVIAGAVDGSTDALQNGALGMLIDPDDREALSWALKESLNAANYDPLQLQEKVIEAFGFVKYKERLKNYLRALE